MRWCVVVPVKRLADAKSRLRGCLPDISHDDLVLALVRDTLAAVLACPVVARTLVVTGDGRIARAATGLGAAVLPDPARGLNAAFTTGAAAARGEVLPGDTVADRPAARPAQTGGTEQLSRPAQTGGTEQLSRPAQTGGTEQLSRPARTGGTKRFGGAVAGLTGDLAALRPADLAAALDAAGRAGGSSFVADAAGTGTTMLAAPAGVPLSPRFGPGSAAAHRAGGAVPLDGPWPSLRLDVDTAADLATAAGLGLGRHLTALLRGRHLTALLRGRHPAVSLADQHPAVSRPAGYPAVHAGDGGQLRPANPVRHGVPR